MALGRNHADLPPPTPVTAETAVEPEHRLWPDPTSIRTITGFLTNLAAVREISGLTQQEVSRCSAGRISTGTISRLTNRDTLPATWNTTAVYLAACSVPDDQIQQWHGTWQELRNNAPAPHPTPLATPQGDTAEHGNTRRRFFALWRSRGHDWGQPGQKPRRGEAEGSAPCCRSRSQTACSTQRSREDRLPRLRRWTAASTGWLTPTTAVRSAVPSSTPCAAVPQLHIPHRGRRTVSPVF